MSGKLVYIYLLSDPISGEARYVGKSIDPDYRLYEHIIFRFKDKNLHKRHWINKLICCNLKPNLNIIERVDNIDNWENRERYWIKTLREAGCNMINISDGGFGSKGYVPFFSEEHKKRISAALKGRIKSPEHLRKIGLATSRNKKGLPFTEIHKKHLSEARKGIIFSEKTKLKMSLAAKARCKRDRDKNNHAS